MFDILINYLSIYLSNQIWFRGKDIDLILGYENTTGSPSSLSEPHKQHNMSSNYKGLYGIFDKISMEGVKSGNIQ